MTAYLSLTALIAFCLGLLVGGLYEYARRGGTHDAQGENDALREQLQARDAGWDGRNVRVVEQAQR